MVVQKRIQKIRKQSRIASPPENLWFFSEESAKRQLQGTEKPLLRNDRLSASNSNQSLNVTESFRKQMTKKECSFVVDWQMSDTF
jgi:hypothetical protein